MKTIKIIAVLVMTLIGYADLEAQTTAVANPTTTTTAPEKAILTADQKALLQSQRDLAHSNKESFKASLTAEQLAIVENKDLDRKAKHAALAATFTDAKKSILKENRENVKTLREDFKKTLTDEQRQQLRARNEGKDKNNVREQIKESRNRGLKKH